VSFLNDSCYLKLVKVRLHRPGSPNRTCSTLGHGRHLVQPANSVWQARCGSRSLVVS
jgi:hypothetical protein